MARILSTSLLLLALALARTAAADARTFATPEEAGAELAAALAANDDKALMDVLGAGADAIMGPGSDPVVAANRKDLAEVAKKKIAVDRSDPKRAILLFGEDGWPVPIPLVPDGARWRFDVAQGKDEVLARKIGRNELRALQICADYQDMQAEYASEDRNGNKVREYAQKLMSAPGTHDGLYWPDPKGDDPSPIAVELDDAATPKAGEPYGGYRWRILTAQGANAPGGAYSYIINGNMIAGFGLIGVPAEYRESGVMTFITSNHGQVYQKDLGPQTAEVAKAITTYDPDSSWTELTPEDELDYDEED